MRFHDRFLMVVARPYSEFSSFRNPLSYILGFRLTHLTIASAPRGVSLGEDDRFSLPGGVGFGRRSLSRLVYPPGMVPVGRTCFRGGDGMQGILLRLQGAVGLLRLLRRCTGGETHVRPHVA